MTRYRSSYLRNVYPELRIDKDDGDIFIRPLTLNVHWGVIHHMISEPSGETRRTLEVLTHVEVFLAKYNAALAESPSGPVMVSKLDLV